MKRLLIKGKKCKAGKLCTIMMAFAMLVAVTIPVYGVTLNELEKQKQDAKKQQSNAQSQLDSVQSEIEGMSEEMDAMEEELAQIDEELVDLLLSIDIIESDISSKNDEIAQAQSDYDAAVITEEEQRNAMKRRIKFMYEKGETSYLSLLLESRSMAEAVNKMDYSEKLYEYDRQLLENYKQTKQDVYDTKTRLETELSELEEIQQDMEEQKTALQAMVAEKQETLENFDEQLNAAKDKANSYKSQIKQQANAIKQIEAEQAAKIAEEEAKKKAEEEAKKKQQEAASASGSSQSSGSSQGTSASPGNASLGQEIANYACQFVGNPYVAGGTSLTDGCDCSGFTSSVYAHFGIGIPRSSYAQSAAGREVSYSDLQPGDIMYYGGHVAIYIGNNSIVHASTAATGIKISNASYRTVITIRRFV